MFVSFNVTVRTIFMVKNFLTSMRVCIFKFACVPTDCFRRVRWPDIVFCICLHLNNPTSDELVIDQPLNNALFYSTHMNMTRFDIVPRLQYKWYYRKYTISLPMYHTHNFRFVILTIYFGSTFDPTSSYAGYVREGQMLVIIIFLNYSNENIQFLCSGY